MRFFPTLVTILATTAVAEDLLFIDFLQYYEYSESIGTLNMTAKSVTEDEWRNMTTADFAAYKAIILADPACYPRQSILQFVIDTKDIWGPAVEGNMIMLGTDPSYHFPYVPGAKVLIDSAINFAAAGKSSDGTSQTGLYFALSCYYGDSDSATVDVLSYFGDFVAGGNLGCYNKIHIVASSPALPGLSDADLSDWSCSIHEVFSSYPQGGRSGFQALAIAQDIFLPGTQTFEDGAIGIPYIITRGATPAGCGNGIWDPGFEEECDDGVLNGTPGDPCSVSCKCLSGIPKGNGTCVALIESSLSSSSASSTFFSSLTSTFSSPSTFELTTSTLSSSSSESSSSTSSPSSSTSQSVASTSSSATSESSTSTSFFSSSESTSSASSLEPSSTSSTAESTTSTLSLASSSISSTFSISSISSLETSSISSSDSSSSSSSSVLTTTNSTLVSSTISSTSSSSIPSSILSSSVISTSETTPIYPNSTIITTSNTIYSTKTRSETPIPSSFTTATLTSATTVLVAAPYVTPTVPDRPIIGVEIIYVIEIFTECVTIGTLTFTSTSISTGPTLQVPTFASPTSGYPCYPCIMSSCSISPFPTPHYPTPTRHGHGSPPPPPPFITVSLTTCNSPPPDYTPALPVVVPCRTCNPHTLTWLGWRQDVRGDREGGLWVVTIGKGSGAIAIDMVHKGEPAASVRFTATSTASVMAFTGAASRRNVEVGAAVGVVAGFAAVIL